MQSNIVSHKRVFFGIRRRRAEGVGVLGSEALKETFILCMYGASCSTDRSYSPRVGKA